MVIKINQNLSKSIITSWKITRHPIPLTNYNIISVVFFLKYKSYKDVNVYINGLTKIITSFSKLLPGFRLRIYHDYSVVEIINNILIKIPDIKELIELYEYDISFFREKENILYHKGTIGTLIRYLPLLNIEYHKVDKCIIFDIDNVIQPYIKTFIDFFETENINFAYRSRLCYSHKRIRCLSDYHILKYPLVSSLIYQNINNIPYNIFDTFIEDLYINNKLDKLIDKCTLISKYEYGIDEIFMNEFYLKHLYKNKITIAPILFNHVSILHGIKRALIDSDKNNSLYHEFVNKFFKCININIEIDNISLIVDIIDKNERYIKKQIENKIKNPFYNNKLRKFIISFLHNKKYTFINYLLICILNELKYINMNVNTILILNTDYKDHAIVTNIEKKTFNFYNKS